MTNLNIYTTEQRKAYVEDWKKSGLTQKEYSAPSGLKDTTLSTWVQKLLVNEDSVECVFRALRKVNGCAQ